MYKFTLRNLKMIFNERNNKEKNNKEKKKKKFRNELVAVKQLTGTGEQ